MAEGCFSGQPVPGNFILRRRVFQVGVPSNNPHLVSWVRLLYFLPGSERFFLTSFGRLVYARACARSGRLAGCLGAFIQVGASCSIG